MKVKIFSILILALILTFSCGKKKLETNKWAETDLNCGKAEITKIIGNNEYFGGGKDLTVKCKVKFENLEFESELVIDVSLIGEAYSPFKVGDIVVAKFLKTDQQKTVEMYLLESIDNRTGYKWESIYTLEEACNGNWPKGSEQQKVFSAKGKI
ncbi:hypothetical protein [uncultured Algibacter sp.]|uniref:hypothetical protein n=1 Tax=uncultured Algibacter sp. TaxID=298659 RepID=UPI002617F2E4|nr:hypothetical protein [uncultured Algibacter sp.]